MTAELPELLRDGEMVILGRLREASNQTFVVRIEGTPAVYKPIAGEAPLWDFPDGTLAAREYSAYLVSEALGWSLVPITLLRDGPAGPGMVQVWIEQNDDEPVHVVPAGDCGELRHVLDAEDSWGRPVSLVHEDTPALRRIAIFDLVINNTDRKGSHILPVSAEPGRYAIDHGVCFHAEDKVRTVLWGWAGERITGDEASAVEGVLADEDLATALAGLLTPAEVMAMRRRCATLVAEGRFPEPQPGWPPIPWPPL